MFWSIKVQAKFKQSFKEVFKLYLEHFRFFASNNIGSKKSECLKMKQKTMSIFTNRDRIFSKAKKT